MHVAASTGRVVAGRYLLQQPIGRGAMGTVWRARDSVLARDVAVKEVRFRTPATTGSARPEDTRVLYERSLREARTAARLNHPAVVTVFDVIEADGSPWIVMELVEARSLEQVLAEDGPLPPQQAADLGGRLLSALHCAHQAGILHRDVKPSNVLLGPDGRAVLTDFGIATLEGEPGLTQAGMVMGTPGFTAPERVRGEPATPASDLWSLGATLFAAVEGHGPFDRRGSSMAILAAIANEEAPPTRRAGPLRPAIEALLHRDPRARPAAAAVARLLAGERATVNAPPMTGGRPDGPQEPPWGQPWPGDDGGTLPESLEQPGRPDGNYPPGLGEPAWTAAATQTARPAAPGPAAGGRDDPETAGSRHGLPAGPGMAATAAALLLRNRGAWLAALAAVAMVSLVLSVLVARAHRAAAASTAGYRTVQVSGAAAGSAAGFRMKIPAGWQSAQRGPTTAFTSPDGSTVIQVTPAVFHAARAVGEARLLEALALRRGTFPGYQRITLHAAGFHGRPGAVWQFTWQPASGPRAEVSEWLFRLATQAGPQAYLVQESAPATAWLQDQAAFTTAQGTFQSQP
ncbi:MAG: serine/threonine-protein kinase [Streptosporangiales bacterium]